MSERLAVDLRSSNLAWKQADGVSILQFKANAELTQSAHDLEHLRREVLPRRRRERPKKARLNCKNWLSRLHFILIRSLP